MNLRNDADNLGNKRIMVNSWELLFLYNMYFAKIRTLLEEV